LREFLKSAKGRAFPRRHIGEELLSNNSGAGCPVLREFLTRAAVIVSMVPLLAAQPATRADAAARTGRAVRLMQDRQYAEAAAEFEKALAADPNNDVLRIQYATCLFAAERNAEARREFEIERKKLGDKPGLNYYLGRLDLRANDFSAAIKKLAPLESDPALAGVSFYLGLAYMSTGQAERARACLERAAKSDPGNPQVHYRLARLYSMAGRAGDADREYKLYLDSQESRQVAEHKVSECKRALRTQPIAQARIVCQRIADPPDARRLILLGELYSASGAFTDAIEPLRQAVKLDPESFDAWNTLGLSLFSLKRYQEALSPLRKAASLNPEFFDTLSLLASTLHALGDDAAALPVLEQAHKLNPDDAQVKSRLEQVRAALKDKR
jgi:tetratricopeptide (TPR) repeat protein